MEILEIDTPRMKYGNSHKSFGKTEKTRVYIDNFLYLCNRCNSYSRNKNGNMKFYNRKSELAELRRIRDLSFSDHSRLTVVTGRRRIGKTKPYNESC